MKIVEVNVIIDEDASILTRFDFPPQVSKSNLEICINSKRFFFEFVKDDKLHFVYQYGFELVQNPKIKINYSKGTGLLDVYLDCMSIVVPDNASETLKKIAGRFSTPSSNGFDPKIYTPYPVASASDVDDDLKKRNLVVLDLNGNNEFLRQIEIDFPIRADTKGSEYLGQRYDGDYCVMQVIPNPYNETKSVLVISGNSEEMLRKNMFTRKVVVPSYYNGLHLHWNNQALIFMNNRYWGVYEWGEEVKAV